MMTTTISGLGSSKNIYYGYRDPVTLDFQLVVTHPQGMYYCSVGGKYSRKRLSRASCRLLYMQELILKESTKKLQGQWEFQIFAKGAKAAGDQIWVSVKF